MPPLLDLSLFEAPGTVFSVEKMGKPWYASIYGIKWNDNNTITIVTDRAPMWGDFYAKGGSDSYAFNENFGTDAPDPYGIGNGNNGGWVLVPDTTSVPIPSAALLLGVGLMGMVGLRRKVTKS